MEVAERIAVGRRHVEDFTAAFGLEPKDVADLDRYEARYAADMFREALRHLVRSNT